MVRIEFRITDEVKEEIQSKSDNEFNEVTDIEGQFKFTVGLNSIGYVDLNIPLSEELLIHWFLLLNRVVSKLRFEKYVVLAIPDRFKHWLIFTNDENALSVSEVEVKSEIDSGFLATTQLTDIEKEVWESKVNYLEFETEVNRVTNDFIEDASATDVRLKDLRSLTKLVVLSKELKIYKESFKE